MKIGVGLAALSALVAKGKDFNREELNAMLDKLAASPEPKVKSGPQATCYKVAMPRPEVFEYVCKKCGTHTVYPANTQRIGNRLARFRDDAASLKSIGLDITLDESVLCQKCHPQECWISAKYVSESGEVLGDDVRIRAAPSLDAKVVREVSKRDGARVKRLPAQKGDPAEWMRIEEPLADYTDRIDKLAWVINGKRTIVHTYDARILKAFLAGKTIWKREFDEEVSVKNALPRLKELLGEPKK